jgi:hypothetical protein
MNQTYYAPLLLVLFGYGVLRVLFEVFGNIMHIRFLYSFSIKHQNVYTVYLIMVLYRVPGIRFTS